MKTAREIWQTALGELQIQVSKPNFDTWLKDTTGIGYQDDTFVVGVPSVFVSEWLGNRLRSLIKRTLASITGKNVSLEFRVQASGKLNPCRAPSLQADGGISSKLIEPMAPPRLNPRYTFDTFITGESNRLAYAASLEAAENPGRTYNPLYIYGGNGVGKTHLLHAIAHATNANGMQIVYISAERFTNEFVTALRSDRISEFQRKFRNADVLLFDDIQFLSGKVQTQECIYHTFNDLYDDGHQIVFTSDCAPRGLSWLQKRLSSRLEWGLVADIQPPDFETRFGILSAKSRQIRAVVPEDILRFLAAWFSGNVRELEGALNRVVTYAKLNGCNLDLPLAREALADMLPEDELATIKPKLIINAVADFYALTPEALIGRGRDRKTALARQVAMYLLREQNHCHLAEIGKLLGGRDHATVLHGCQKIDNEAKSNHQLSKSIEDIRKRLIQ